MDKRLLLVDGHSLANRAFYALPPLSTSDGTPTGAVFGFLAMLLRFLSEKRPSHVAVAFDLPAPTFRHAKYADYKAKRKPAPPEFKEQIPVLKQMLDVLRLPRVEMEGYEADDIIGTLARQWKERGLPVTILSGDRDCLQLVDEGVEAILPVKGISQVKEYLPDAVKADMGVRPDQVRDYKALRGDASDNIPGVKGIGEKTAAALLQEFGDLDEIYRRLSDVAPAKVRNLLSAGRETAFLSRELAAIDTCVPLDAGDAVDRYRRLGPDLDEVRGVFAKMEFHTLIPRLSALTETVKGTEEPACRPSETIRGIGPGLGIREPAASDDQPADRPSAKILEGGSLLLTAGEPRQLRLIDTEEELSAFAEEVKGTGRLGIYAIVTEITKDFRWPEVLGVSSGESYGVIQTAKLGDDGEAVWRGLGPLLTDNGVTKAGFDLKWVFTLCFKRGIRPRGDFFDVLIAAYLLDPTRTDYRLQDMVRKYTGEEIPELPESKEPANEMDLHLAAGAHACLEMVPACRAELAHSGLNSLAQDVEFPLIEVLAAMEATGVGVDLYLGRSIRSGFADALRVLEDAIYGIAGEKFNLGSPKQLAHVLFEELGLKPVKKTKTGYSTDAEVLEALSLEHELPAKILEYRQYAKLKSTYLDVLEDVVNPTTGRIHSTFHQTVTATGRLSSSEPNLQNIPVRGDLGRSLRRIFVPAENRLFLASDYSQIELRIMAHMADDPSMIDAFVRGEDIHTRTASEIFGVPVEKVDSDLRSKAKAVNFGIIYGISDFGLARNTGVSRNEARTFIEAYFARYPKVREFMDRAVETARQFGYVSTILGRRRGIPEIDSRIRAKRGFAERTAINTPIQGSAADIIKLAMVRIYRRMREEDLVSRLILQVHDELIFEIPPEEEDIMRNLVRTEMEGAVRLKVPLKVDIDVGKSWYDV